MLFVSAMIYNLECVDISVQKVGVGSSQDDSVCGEDSCPVDLDEDDYLALTYRTDVSKPYLSNEWGSFFNMKAKRLGVVQLNSDR